MHFLYAQASHIFPPSPAVSFPPDYAALPLANNGSALLTQKVQWRQCRLLVFGPAPDPAPAFFLSFLVFFFFLRLSPLLPLLLIRCKGD